MASNFALVTDECLAYGLIQNLDFEEGHLAQVSISPKQFRTVELWQITVEYPNYSADIFTHKTSDIVKLEKLLKDSGHVVIGGES